MLKIGNYSMRTVFTLSLLVFIIFCPVPSIPGNIEQIRREEWPVVKTASVTIGDQKYNVYHDPQNPSHIIIYPDCWLIMREKEMVVMPNCAYELVGETLYFDKTWRDPKGYVTGVEWGDPKMSNISFLSTIFRKPKFKNSSVSIWDGDKWIHVFGLPEVSEAVK